MSAILVTTMCMTYVKVANQREEAPAIVKLSYTVADEDGMEVERLVIDLASDKSFGTVHFNTWTPEPEVSNLTISVNAEYYSREYGWGSLAILSFVMAKGSNMVDKTFIDDFSTDVHVINATVSPT